VHGTLAGHMGERWAVPISTQALDLMTAQLRNSAARWTQVPEGESLSMTWRS